jgi:hypothetical protein
LNVVDPNSIPGSGSRFDQIAKSAAEAGAVNTSQGGDGVTTKVTMYRNGFVVDDGPLRDFNSPDNAQFLQAIERGQVPAGRITQFLCVVWKSIFIMHIA